jgi:hypothetical protein
MSEKYHLKLIEQLKAPPVNDIPARLRLLADEIEQGIVQTGALYITSVEDYERVIRAFGPDVDFYKAHFNFCKAVKYLEDFSEVSSGQGRHG